MQPPETVTLAGAAAGLAAVFLARPRRPRRAGPPRNHLDATGSGTISTPVEHLPRGHWRDGVRDWDARAPGPGPPPYFARRASGFGHTPFQVSTARAAAAEPLAELESARGAGADKSAADEWLCAEELGHRDYRDRVANSEYDS